MSASSKSICSVLPPRRQHFFVEELNQPAVPRMAAQQEEEEGSSSTNVSLKLHVTLSEDRNLDLLDVTRVASHEA